MEPELILFGGRITTLAPVQPEASAVAVSQGKIAAIGTDDEVLRLAGPKTLKIDLNNRRVIPRDRRLE